MNITVLTPPAPTRCVMCDTVKSKLQREGMEYSSVEITTRPDIEVQARDAGMTSFPLVQVVTDDGTEQLYSGPTSTLEMISKLKKDAATAAA